MDILSVNFQLITMMEKTEEPVRQQHIHYIKDKLLITDNLS
jgi:hypothetical protein